jgi:hypothetical protein
MTFIAKRIGTWVRLYDPSHPDEPSILGGRAGTVLATKDELIAVFGKPRDVLDGDEKVTYRWVFETPHGFVEVRDYWWNGPREHSIGSADNKATQYVVHFLRSKELTANYGRRFAPSPAPIR